MQRSVALLELAGGHKEAGMVKHWVDKFRNAFRGIGFGIHGQTSFLIHFLAAIVVVLLATVLHCTLVQWCVLGLCIAMVLTLELVNSSIESLAKGLCREHNSDVGKALDISAAAVLIASLIALAIGLAIFARQLSLI